MMGSIYSPGLDKDRGRGEAERGVEGLELEKLFYKDCSFGSIKT